MARLVSFTTKSDKQYDYIVNVRHADAAQWKAKHSST